MFTWEVLSLGAPLGASVLKDFQRLCWSGSVLCKLLSSAVPGSLDERAVNDSDGGFDLTASCALENFQLCHSCAQAQGCDVQGLAVEQLFTCEVSYLTDFVLEILRVSAVQAIPASDRRFLVGSAPQAPRPAATAAAGADFPGGRGAPPPAMPGLQGGRRTLRVQMGGAGGAVAAGEGSEHAAPDPAPLPGTAAARRAAVGLERWALQLLDAPVMEPGPSPSSTSSLSASPADASAPGTPVAAPDVSPAPGPPLQLSPPALPPGGAALAPPVGSGRSGVLAGTSPLGFGETAKNGVPRSGSRGNAGAGVGREAVTAAGAAAGPASTAAAGLGTRAAGTEVENATGPDPLGLEAWEGLAALLSRSASADACADVNQAEGTPGVAGRGSPQAAAGVIPARTATTVTAGLRVAVPGSTVDGDEQARWDAVAAALSAALAAVPAHGSPLPALRAEHLRCRHPGLRSLVLARALLAHCRQRDRLPAAAAPPPPLTAAADPARALGVSGSFTSGNESAEDASAAAAAVAAAAAKALPASPAPPLPQRRQPPSAPGSLLRRHRSTGGPQPVDLLSEHNLLVQQEHQQREMRRQQLAQQQHRSAGGDKLHAGGGIGAGTMANAAAEGNGVLWSGDGDDEGEDQEERVLRLWLNSLDPGIHVTSLFELEVTTGWPLLQALEAIQPGCVPWSDAFRPPFKEKLRKILSVQNCNLVIEVCTRQLAMPPLVNIGGLDLALGQRRATLSLVFQMMRHHMGMLLGLAAPHPPPPPPSPHGAATTAAVAAARAPQYHHHQGHGHNGHSHSHHFGHGYGYGHDLSPHGAPHLLPCAPSPHRGTRAYVEVEKAVLAWANAKLMEAAVAAAAAAAAAAAGGSGGAAAAAAPGGGVAPQLPFNPLASFSDKRLGEGRVLLQLLSAICPRSVNAKYVLPGRNEEERGSNARYLLSCARKLGCVIFLSWEDVVAARPNLLLLLLASFMALDRKRAGAAEASAALVAAAAGPVRAPPAVATLPRVPAAAAPAAPVM